MSVLKQQVLAGFFLSSALTTSVFAAETLFAFTPGVDTMPKGQSEIALSLAKLDGLRDGDYTALTFAADYERGVGDDLSVNVGLGGLYVNSDDDAFGAGPAGQPVVPAFSEERLSRVKVGVQRRILSPYTDGVGLAARADVTFDWFGDAANGKGAKQYSVSPALIIQKNYLDDTLNLGANIAADFRHGCLEDGAPAGTAERCRNEILFRPSLGAAYRFARKWNVAAEGVYRKRFSALTDAPGGFFIGPSIHYGQRRWYATASFFWQVAGHSAFVPPTSMQFFANNARLENEREFRLRVGVNF